MKSVAVGRWTAAGIWLLRLVAFVLVAGSLLSMTDLNQWWVRIWDFPRLQILIAMVLIGFALWRYDRASRPWLPLLLAAFCVWQFWRIWPYTPMASAEVARVEPGQVRPEACFTALTLNVLQDNREYSRTVDLIRRVDPDVVLLMETDQAWADAMAPVLQSYPGQIHRPIDNTYGIMFASRLPMRDASIQDLAQADTPSVFATLTAGGQDFRMIGLHPRPPRPRQDTEERDAEIVIVARKARASGMPVLAIGDFNDVAWSDTTQLFKNVGGFLDPRIGRGPHATFPAGMVWLGWPLDHLFVTKEFLFKDVQVSESVGSDHRAMIAELCLSPSQARARNEESESPDAEDREEAREVMDEYRDDAAEDRVEGEGG